MEFDPDERHESSIDEQQANLIDSVISILIRKDVNEKNLTMARQMLFEMPRTLLQEASPKRLARWLVRIQNLIEQRTQPYEVVLEPLTQSDHWHLITLAEDAYFLFDSVQNVLLRNNLSFRVFCHPILSIARFSQGQSGADFAQKENESLVWIELEGLGRAEARTLQQEIEQTIDAVLKVHQDRSAMVQTLKSMATKADLEACWPLIHWLVQANFIPTAYRLVCQDEPDAVIHIACNQSLGLSTRLDHYLEGGCGPLELPPHIQQRFARRNSVYIEELAARSPFHRSEHLTCIGFRLPEGEGWKDHLFYGFFTQKAQDEVAASIYSLRTRIDMTLAQLKIPPDSHDSVKAIEIINAFPKVELFLMSDQQLRDVISEFPRFYRHEGVKLVPMPRLSPNRMTLVMILPKGYYNPDRSDRIEHFFARHFKAETVSMRVTHVSKNYLHLHVHIDTNEEGGWPEVSKLETALTRLTLPWPLVFRRQLEAQDPELALDRWQRYTGAFPDTYRARMHPRYAVRDVRNIERLRSTGQESFDLWGPFQDGPESYYRLQFYSHKTSYLNDLMPLLENLLLSVLEENDFEVRLEGEPVHIKSFAVRFDVPSNLDMTKLRDGLLHTLTAMRRGHVENDSLHSLQPLTGLSWEQVDIFRAYRNYYFQLGNPFTKTTVGLALINNPQVVSLLYHYFEARFKPEEGLKDQAEREDQRIMPVRVQLADALQQVTDINEDRILRTLFNLIDSTVRTNFYTRLGTVDAFISFKINTLGVIDMPAPRPMFEIYVHSATVEGIHLRGGKVARGGIRWSDRPDDFRTEVLGLMKAQMTKNAVIVPVGSKGGFIVKTPYHRPEEGRRLSREAYITFMRGLLDLTDNRIKDRVVTPPGVITYDDPDPYLVVAADKGTAHLPDTANAVSAEYDFWLGDAFASGGSHGYDHKVEGITARGAWESVKRHFREMGHDTQTQPFTVVGIGDMSGDVFGNGMLLSPQIRLQGAFNHRHIFIDPDPDPATSFQERQRLFSLAGSAWTDYDPALISAGGGVFDRTSKEIPVSPQMRDWLGIRHATIDGQELIRRLLQAPVDLLWNGGIGTYVRASSENDEDAGDRANDAVRIDATQLRAKVVGEGGNLGLTQLARIEFASLGGAINTDALDNSGGVDCSDHEVNIKIFMQSLIEQKVLPSLEARHAEVAAVTQEVNALVLQNNYTQSLCITLDRLRSAANVEPYIDLMQRLDGSGLLDAADEQLPSSKEVRARDPRAFYRPELFVLMAYSKMYVFRHLLDSSLPDDEGVRAFLPQYFPEGIQQKFGPQIASHPLAREITATLVTNQFVDQGGSALWQMLARRTGATLVETVRTYLFFDRILQADALRQAVYALDNRLTAEVQHRLLLDLETVIERFCLSALDAGLDVALVDAQVRQYREQVDTSLKLLSGLLAPETWDQCQQLAAQLVDAGMDDEHARKLAAMRHLQDMLPLFTLSRTMDEDLFSVIKTFNEVQAQIGVQPLEFQMALVPQQDRWDQQAGDALQRALEASVLKITEAVLQEAGGNLESYFGQHRARWRTFRSLRDQVLAVPQRNFHPFTVALRALDAMLHSRSSRAE